MRKLCMMLLLSVFCAVLGSQSTTTEFKTNSIVMEDTVMMFASTDDPGDAISEIKIYDLYNQLVLNVPVCGSHECTSDIGELAKGYYNVEIKSVKGLTQSGLVERG